MGCVTDICAEVESLQIELFVVCKLFGFVHTLALAGAFLLVAFLHLHELLEGGFGVEQFVGFGANAGSFLAGLDDFELGVGFVGRENSFR